MPDHVAIVALCWFLLWTSAGVAVCSWMYGEPYTGAVTGFFLGFGAFFAWPWILPDFLQDWLYT